MVPAHILPSRYHCGRRDPVTDVRRRGYRDHAYMSMEYKYKIQGR